MWRIKYIHEMYSEGIKQTNSFAEKEVLYEIF